MKHLHLKVHKHSTVSIMNEFITKTLKCTILIERKLRISIIFEMQYQSEDIVFRLWQWRERLKDEAGPDERDRYTARGAGDHGPRVAEECEDAQEENQTADPLPG